MLYIQAEPTAFDALERSGGEPVVHFLPAGLFDTSSSERVRSLLALQLKACARASLAAERERETTRVNARIPYEREGGAFRKWQSAPGASGRRGLTVAHVAWLRTPESVTGALR